jgi:AraC-like DNA-binding protein
MSGLLREAVLRASSWTPALATPLTDTQAHIAAVILDEIRTLPVEPFGLPLPQDPRLQRIARALIADPSNNQGMEHWADWAAVSLRTLSRRFVTETGFNFTAWRQRARLMRSLEMLAAGEPVATIAYDLGYSSPSAFISLFRRSFGHTPASYRSQL